MIKGPESRWRCLPRGSGGGGGNGSVFRVPLKGSVKVPFALKSLRLKGLSLALSGPCNQDYQRFYMCIIEFCQRLQFPLIKGIFIKSY